MGKYQIKYGPSCTISRNFCYLENIKGQSQESIEKSKGHDQGQDFEEEQSIENSQAQDQNQDFKEEIIESSQAQSQDQDFEEEKIIENSKGQGHDSKSGLEADDENDSVATTCNSPYTPSPVIMDIAPKRSLRMAKPKKISAGTTTNIVKKVNCN